MAPDQKAADFRQLAATFAKNYGPAQWKRDYLNFDLLNIGDWLKRAAASQDDLEFYDLCVRYVASLHDAHSGFYIPSDFEAVLPFRVDLYEGHAMVDSVSSGAARIPVRVGDELLSIDGVPAATLLDQLLPYAEAGNPDSTRRMAAAFLTDRPQAFMARAPEVGDTAALTFRRRDGTVETVTATWNKFGTPLNIVGPVISPFQAARPKSEEPVPDYMAPLRRLRRMRLPAARFVQGFGSTQPVFTSLPKDFNLRLGDRFTDALFSGTYESGGARIGFIRIPSFELGELVSAFAKEIAYMQQNTDGLVIDIMRNPGGDGCVAQELLRQVIPYKFQTVGLEIRATRTWVTDFQLALADAIDANAPQDVIDQYRNMVAAAQEAFLTPSGRTSALPVCGPTLELEPATDSRGRPAAYTRPVLLLTDEFSASAADLFAAVFQDAGRGPILGTRTLGAGGNVEFFFGVTTYSDGEATITESLMARKAPVSTGDFPPTHYVENVGVRPEIELNYMTLDNLAGGGQPFVEGFTRAVVEHIRAAPR